MSEHARRKKAKGQQEPEPSHHSKEQAQHRAEAKGEPSTLQDAAGNQSAAQLLGQMGTGQPLSPETEVEMEQAFGTAFGEVRLHDDPKAQAAAEELNATAFTRGDDIYLGPDAPPLQSDAGKQLLAHELAHVVQQRQARTVQDGQVSQPDDSLERMTEQVAQQASQGQPVREPGDGAPATVPAVQRQFKHEGASQAEVKLAIQKFLERVQAAQGGRSLRVTTIVRNAMEMLANADDPAWKGPGGDPNRAFRLEYVQAFLSQPALPGSPAEFAEQISKKLPVPFNRAALTRLEKMPVSEQPTKGFERVAEVAERTAPGSAEREEEEAGAKAVRGEKVERVPGQPPQAPQQPSPIERLEEVEQINRTIRGEEEPTKIGPVSVDVLHLGRIIGGLTKKKPQKSTREPQAGTYPEVEQAIGKIPSNALTPVEARGKPEADNFADAHLVARDLARLLDLAQQAGQKQVKLQLGANYSTVKDKEVIRKGLRQIVAAIRQALPHRASNVGHVDVFFGDKLFDRIN